MKASENIANKKPNEFPEKVFLYKYRWYIALLNFLQPGLGFITHRKWLDSVLTFSAYSSGLYITFQSLSSPDSPSWQLYLGVALVTISYIYSIVKPLLAISPEYTNSNNETNSNPNKSKFSSVGIEKFWLLQFLNRLWPGLGLLMSRFWYIGLAICLLGIGMYIIPSILWPENELWMRKILFVITFGLGFWVTISMFGYGGIEKSRTWLVIGSVALLSILNVRFTDIIRDNFVFMTITDKSLNEYGLKQGDLLIAKMIDEKSQVSDGYLILYGNPNRRENAQVMPYRRLLDRDSVFAIAVKTLYPKSEPIGKPPSGFALTQK